MEFEIRDIVENGENFTGTENYIQKLFPFLSSKEHDGYPVIGLGNILQVSLVSLLLLVLSVQFLRRKSSKAKSQDATGKIISINRETLAYNWFPTLEFPIFKLIDGFITLHRLRTEGVKYLEWLDENWGNLFTIPLGFTNVVVVADANAAQKILSSNDPHHLNKPHAIYDFLFVEFLQNGIVNSEAEVWAPHRKILGRSFTYKALCTYSKLMNTHANNLMEDLLRSCLPEKKEGACNISDSNCITGTKMYDLIYFHTIKIISDICMGSNCCTNDEAIRFHQIVVRWKQIVLYRFLHPILLVSPIWWLHPLSKEHDYYNKEFTKFMLKVINGYRTIRESEAAAERIRGQVNTDKPTNSTEDANLEGDGVKPFRCLIEEMIISNLNDKEIFDEFGTIMLTGHETVATALQMLMFNLALNPDHQSECRKEVDSIFDGKRDQICNDLTMDDLTNLKYLERCILESGRLTTSVPMFLRRLDAPVYIDDQTQIDAGSNLVFMVWNLHLDPEHFPNPKKFDPDRFLPENVLKRHPYAYIPFSTGARNCIGWKMAIMEMKIIMAWMLRHFEIYTSDGPDDVKLHFEVTLLPERHYNITLKKRQIA